MLSIPSIRQAIIRKDFVAGRYFAFASLEEEPLSDTDTDTVTDTNIMVDTECGTADAGASTVAPRVALVATERVPCYTEVNGLTPTLHISPALTCGAF